MRGVDFSGDTLARRWWEIKSHLREDLVPWTRNPAEAPLESYLEEEEEHYLLVSRYEGIESGLQLKR